MLSLATLKSASSAYSYYEADNYYAKDSLEAKAASEWWGKGANVFGLEGPVDSEQFKLLLEGALPNGCQLGRIEKGSIEHRPGVDLTFSAPKSVSLLAEVGQDTRITAAHDNAVNSTLTYLEQHTAQTRRSEDCAIIFEKTDNFIVAKFRHDTSREQDPQLHTHCVLINATQRQDGKWRSLSCEKIFENKMLGGLIYRSVLAHEVQQLGYSITKTHLDGRFEINGVPQKIIETFSKRREAIQQSMQKEGFEGAKAAEVATLVTRQSKHIIDRHELHQHWQRICQAEGFDVKSVIHAAIEKEKSLPFNPVTLKDSAEKSVNYACAHLSEREARFSHVEVLRIALAHGLGSTLLPHIESAIHRAQKNHQLINVTENNSSHVWTTPEAMKLEKETINHMLDGRFTVKPIISSEKVSVALSKNTPLNTSQKEAAHRLLTSLDRITGIQGYAGTGKTTMLSTVKTLAESAGFEVKGMAPSAVAANQLAEGAGIKSQTLDSYLIDYAKQGNFVKSCAKTLFVLDEASMASTSKMNALLKSVHLNRGRLVLIGDTQQLGAVEAGKPFYQLQKAGMQTALMKDIQRQKNPELKQAVYDAIRGDIQSALKKIGDNVYEIKNKEERLTALAKNYLALSADERQHTLVLTPANEDRGVVNHHIREGLKQEETLTGKPISVTALTNKDLSCAERTLAMNYEIGNVIRFNKSYASMNIKANTYFEVTAIDKENNQLTLKNGHHSFEWQPHQLGGKRQGVVEVYHPEMRELQVGEMIRWQRNDKTQGLYNSDTAKVISLHHSYATLELPNGKTADIHVENRRHQHWDYAYATTVHAAQGKTCDIVLAHGESFRKNLTNQHGFYVTLSRARHEISIYTDNKEDYLKTLNKYVGDKSSALEDKTLSQETSKPDSENKIHTYATEKFLEKEAETEMVL